MLNDSYFEEMIAARERLERVADSLARSAIERYDELAPNEIESLSAMNRRTMGLSMRLSAAITIDQSEGRVRHYGDPPA